MARAANMQALTNDVRREWPGVVVYGIGDKAHQSRASDHNEDDTPGSKAAQSDPDGRPEHRAIDIMIGPKFTKADADALVKRVLADPKARGRLYGVIWHGSQWWRSTGWVRQARTSDPHNDHVHFSGLAADDENTASWPAVAVKTMEAPDMDATQARQLGELHAIVTGWRGGMPKTPDGTSIEPVAWRIRDEAWQAKVTGLLTALSGQIGGLDTAQVLARVEALAGEERERDAALAELVRKAQSGELAAGQFVDEVARRLSGQASE
ncbi:hypothetical protein [Micromonospora taraxaci]|uniref:hypothetical protein n=1 Tax=Micromonospora taraxaci TaxID=1316803 RepID=UPI0033AC3117